MRIISDLVDKQNPRPLPKTPHSKQNPRPLPKTPHSKAISNPKHLYPKHLTPKPSLNPQPLRQTQHLLICRAYMSCPPTRHGAQTGHIIECVLIECVLIVIDFLGEQTPEEKALLANERDVAAFLHKVRPHPTPYILLSNP
jgi:hypothetical protein